MIRDITAGNTGHPAETAGQDNIPRIVPVVAPISGYITTADINIGNYVSPSDVLFGIVNSDNLLLELILFEKDKTESGNSFTEYRMIQVHKGVSDGGYTEVMLPEGFDIQTSKVVVRGAYNLLSAKKNAGEMAC